jgi:hypothetical protein
LDLLFSLVALAGLALPILALIALVMAIGLRQRVRLSASQPFPWRRLVRQGALWRL